MCPHCKSNKKVFVDLIWGVFRVNKEGDIVEQWQCCECYKYFDVE